MPIGLHVPRQRATSPSQASHSIWSWVRSTARSAPVKPGINRAKPEAAPLMIIKAVTALAESPARISIRVR
jgi:hypothetical protein